MYRYDISDEVEKISGLNSPLVDVAVLLVFFNRPDTLIRVFERVCTARPSRLLLYQDGARANNPSDLDKIAKCREIVSGIDWDCTVHRLYQEENQGCNPSMYIAQQWAFSQYDKCIVLEDDVVPSISFFSYCKDLLDRYESDTRIVRICGQNILGEYSPYGSDYFFTRGGSIWGWASWSRVVLQWDPDYSFLEDESVVTTFKSTYRDYGVPIDKFVTRCRQHYMTGREHFESIYASYRLLNSGLSIVPSLNMISNIGVSADATHGASDIRLLTRKGQKAFNAPSYEIQSPLIHPKYVLEDRRYELLQSNAMGWKKTAFQKVATKVEESIRRLLFGR